MRFNLISNLANGAGLQRTYQILREELERRGHEVHGVQFNAPHTLRPAEVNIFIETVRKEMFPSARQQWVIPMPEWWDPAWFGLAFNKVLALTHDCHRIFSEKYGARCRYLGWRSKDYMDPTITREPRFLHVAGKSPFKNTAAVIEACNQAHVVLTVVGDRYAKRRIPEAELKQLMNSHLFHLMPSAYEGYGYVLHEAMGVGAILLTTNAPPMNEVQPSILIRPNGAVPRHATVLHSVPVESIVKGIEYVLKLNPEQIHRHRQLARARFEDDEREFQTNLDALLAEGL